MIRRWFAVLLAALSLILVAATPAAASNADGPSSRAAFQLVLNSWPFALAALVGVLATNVTALVTHYRAPQWVKSSVNFVLVTLGASIATIQTIPGHTWKDYVGEIASAWVLSLVAHLSGITAWLQRASANVGIGATATPIVSAPPASALGTTDQGATVY